MSASKIAILSSVHQALDNRVFYREARTLARAGYDVTLIAPHDGDETRDGVRMARWSPADAGLPTHPVAAIRGGDPAYNAAALRALLLGEAGPYRDAVLFNAAAALIVAGRVQTLRDGVEEAAETIDKGLAKALLDCWIAA